jgi:hypothetical protein
LVFSIISDEVTAFAVTGDKDRNRALRELLKHGHAHRHAGIIKV